MDNPGEYSVIHGLMRQPSMVDYPGQLAVLMFTCGCNFHCGFCHNVDLLDKWDARTYTYARLKEKLDYYREEWVQAITVTGGEPTVHIGLPETISFLKGQGFLVKLDTNGSNPEMLETLLPMVDYVAMDIKCALKNYESFVHYNAIERIQESIRLIMAQARDYEFRTTVLPSVHTDEEILGAAEAVRGARRWYFQAFVPHENLPDERYRTLERTKPSVLEHLAAIVRDIVPGVSVR